MLFVLELEFKNPQCGVVWRGNVRVSGHHSPASVHLCQPQSCGWVVTVRERHRHCPSRKIKPSFSCDDISAAYAEIIGTKDKVFNSGSRLQLVCVLTLATSKPDYIFWWEEWGFLLRFNYTGVQVSQWQDDKLRHKQRNFCARGNSNSRLFVLQCWQETK